MGARRGRQRTGAGHLRCVDVSDSLSDTFEYMAYEVTHGRHFVLRARENRRLQAPVAGQSHLFAAARALHPCGRREIRVQASSGRSARTTTVCVAFAAVGLATPRKRHGEYAKAPLNLWVVRVWEPNTPAGEQPLEWILLTNVPVDDPASAGERVDWYERPPIIEMYQPSYLSSNRLYLGRIAA